MSLEQGILKRSELLLGKEMMRRLASLRVIIFGVGGVGSWCAESLVRSGVTHLTLVDSDRVCITNINRQDMATTATIGRVKVEAMRERLLSINPSALIEARQEIFCEATAAGFDLNSYDFVIDAIDSLKDKVLLIETACRSTAQLFSSMGAALKIDPTRIKVAEFWRVEGCPLARALRLQFKKLKRKPARKFLCVYSDELIENRGHNASCGTEECLCTAAATSGDNTTAENQYHFTNKRQPNGSLMHITAIFGLTLAGLVLKDIYAETEHCS